MRVVQVSFFRDPWRRAPEELLRAWPSLSDVACAVAATGVEVQVVQAAAHAARIEHEGVTFHFVADRAGPWSRRWRRFTLPGTDLRRTVSELAPDVLHVHSLSFPLALRRVRTDVTCPIIVQDHADGVPRFPVRWLTAAALRACAGVTFTARAQAIPWREAGCLPARIPVFEVLESSSHFTPGPQAVGRAALGVHGDPAVAWVGRLAPVKDPLTAVRGFAEAVPDLPDPHLWCCFTESPLRDRVEALVRSDPRLHERVHLLGLLRHDQVQTLLRACDLYVAASRREGSGFALLEALACGLTAVVSDIPAFRRLTEEGAVASLFPPGDADAMARALVTAWARHRPEDREVVRAHFDRRLSFASVGTGLREVYETVSASSCA